MTMLRRAIASLARAEIALSLVIVLIGVLAFLTR
jgi:hypothetical protein